MRSLDFIENSYISIYKYLNSNMYILYKQNTVLVIDPHINEEIKTCFFDRNIRNVTIILTHEHSDHISGVWWFLENYECILICSENCSNIISDKKLTRPLFMYFFIKENNKKNGTNYFDQFKKEYVWTSYIANITFFDEFKYEWQGHQLFFKAIQGHSIGSSYIILDNKYVFTGDSLIKDYPIIVNFPQSNKNIFLNETIPLLEKTLYSDMIILSGHGKTFVLSEIMKGKKINVEIR